MAQTKKYQTNLPEIRISTSWILYNEVSSRLHELNQLTGQTPGSEELTPYGLVTNRAAAFRKEWRSYDHQILNGIYQAFELEFYQQVIDVFVTPYFPSLYRPLIIDTGYEPDEFVDKLTHDLIHVLINDNKSYFSTQKLSNLLNKLYPDNSPGATTHIPVHAGSKYLYLDVLEDESRLQRDLKKARQTADEGQGFYLEAWQYVENRGYKEIIEEFKSHYDELG